MKLKSNNSPSFFDSLKQILELTSEQKEIKLRRIFKILSGKGYAALLIIFSLPFCIPIQIPGFSTPFGIILAFLGLRVAFGKHPWWPKWVLEKKFQSERIKKLIKKTMKAVKFMQRGLKPRLLLFTKNALFHRLNGLLVALLSLLLALPLPIPFTNLMTATPILCIGLGLLEDDGIFILLGYFLTMAALGVFFAIFVFGAELSTDGLLLLHKKWFG